MISEVFLTNWTVVKTKLESMASTTDIRQHSRKNYSGLRGS